MNAIRTTLQKLTETATLSGTFSLRCLLEDYTTEAQAAEIIKEAEALYDRFLKKDNRKLLAPAFEFAKDFMGNRELVSLNVFYPSSVGIVSVGAVDLRLVTKDGETRLMLRKIPQKKLARQRKAGVSLNGLRAELIDHHYRLGPKQASLLDCWLSNLDDPLTVFDLDVEEDKLTIVAIKDFRHYAVLSLFFAVV